MIVTWDGGVEPPEGHHCVWYAPPEDAMQFFADYDRARNDTLESDGLPPGLSRMCEDLGAGLVSITYHQNLAQRYRSVQFCIDSSGLTFEGAQSHVADAVAQTYARYRR